MPETKSESLQSIYGSTKVGRKDNKAFTEFKDGWIMGYKCNVHSKIVLHEFYVCIGFLKKGFGKGLNLCCPLEQTYNITNAF